MTQEKHILLRMSLEKWLLYSAGRLKRLQLIVFVRIKSNVSYSQSAPLRDYEITGNVIFLPFVYSVDFTKLAQRFENQH